MERVELQVRAGADNTALRHPLADALALLRAHTNFRQVGNYYLAEVNGWTVGVFESKPGHISNPVDVWRFNDRIVMTLRGITLAELIEEKLGFPPGEPADYRG